MRRYFGPIVCFGVTLCAAPLAAAPDPPDNKEVSAPVAVQRSSVLSTGLSDEAAMVLAGTALLGVAAAVRRAV
jgi:hypothetical protein